MPMYDFKNKETGDVESHRIPLAEYDQFKEDNPHLERTFSGSAPSLVSGVKSAATIAGSGWNDLLGKVKANSGKHNTIKTK